MSYADRLLWLIGLATSSVVIAALVFAGLWILGVSLLSHFLEHEDGSFRLVLGGEDE